MSKNNTPKVSCDTSTFSKNEGVFLIEKLAEIYVREFRNIKTKKDAIRWIDSIPKGYEKPILAMLAFDVLSR